MAQGKISENNEFVTYEIALNETNLVEAEQLEELKRPHPLFLPCDNYAMENQQVTIRYKKQTGYTPLVTYLQADLALKKKIAEQILRVEDLIGTQYTVLLSPNNIYAQESGQIKFAHRGIRSVLPPEKLPEAMLQEIKDVIIFLLKTGTGNDTQTPAVTLANQVASAETIKQIRTILQSDIPKAEPKQKEPAAPETVPVAEPKAKPPVQSVAKPTKSEQKPTQAKPKQETPVKQKAATATRKMLLTGILIGLLIGFGALYLAKVMPLENEVASASDDYHSKVDELEQDQQATQEKLDNQKVINQAYQFAVNDKVKESVAQFEKAKSLSDADKEVLASQYIKLNTPDSLTKAVELNPDNQTEAVNHLVALQSDDANKAILNMESDKPEVNIEKAWLNKDYQQVVDLSGKLKDDKRAKELAAKSYIELDKPADAMKLAKGLKNKDLQIASLKKEIDMVQSDKKMKKDKRKKKIKDLNKQVKKLSK